MAESTPVCTCGLPYVANISAIRDLWAHVTTSSRAVSIAANIAEGFRKRGKAEKLRYYNIAQGSLEECRYYLILTKDLEYSDISEATLLLTEVSKLLEAYSRSILNSDS